MSKSRPQPTLADYMAIAISPALIIVLVGSLAFFLLTIFYAGEFIGKMYWTIACFVFAAVLISRISIVEGAERASLFGLALGVVVALAMMRFTNHPWWAWCVLGVIWWCASHLVWNCTLVDDEDDASGEGLLEAAGLDAALPDNRKTATPQSNDKASAPKRKRKVDAKPSDVRPAVPEPVAKRFFAWWQKGFSRAAPPGLTVVYFSLAALPIFGLGQKFLPMDDRPYAFQLMVRYVASALGLLLTTSFLGLRRYLRQRRLEMPIDMAGTWLGVGAAMAVAILVLAMLIPRPAPEYAISSITGSLGSHQRQASPHAVMRDSPGQGESASQAPANDQTQSQEAQNQAPDDDAANGRSRPGGQTTGSSDGSQPPSASGPSGQQTTSGQGPSSSQAQGNAGNSTDSQGEKQNRAASANENRPAPQNTQEQNGQPAQAQTDGEDNSQTAPAQRKEESDEQKRSADQAAKQQTGSRGGSDRQNSRSQDQNSQQQASSRMAAPQPQTHKMPSFQPLPPSTGAGLLWLLRMLLYAVAFVVGLYCLVRYWHEIKAFLAQAWRELVSLWNSLFDVRQADASSATEQADAQAAKPLSFASFQDPFVSGAVRRQPANAIVQYSFQALEAWASELDRERLAEETPLEFAERIAAEQPEVSEGVRELASLYARVAYARQTLTADQLGGVERLWAGLRRTAPSSRQRTATAVKR